MSPLQTHTDTRLPDKDEFVPEDSPFRNAGLVDKFPMKLRPMTSEIERLFAPKSMTAVYGCTLVYPSMQAWHLTPSIKVDKSWYPLGYRKEGVECNVLEKAPTIIIGITTSAEHGKDTIELDTCWTCAVNGTNCEIRKLVISNKGQVKIGSLILDSTFTDLAPVSPPSTVRAGLHQHESPTPKSSTIKASQEPAAARSLGQAKALTKTHPDSLPTKTITNPAVARSLAFSKAAAKLGPTSTNSSQPAPTPAAKSGIRSEASGAVSHAIAPNSALGKKRKHNGSMSPITTKPPPASTAVSMSPSDWLAEFSRLAKCVPTEVVTPADLEKVNQELRTARKEYAVLVSEKLAVDEKYKTLETSYQENADKLHKAQSESVFYSKASTTSSLELGIQRQRAEKFRTRIIATIREVEGQVGDDGLDLLDDDLLWTRFTTES